MTKSTLLFSISLFDKMDSIESKIGLVRNVLQNLFSGEVAEWNRAIGLDEIDNQENRKLNPDFFALMDIILKDNETSTDYETESIIIKWKQYLIDKRDKRIEQIIT